MTEDWLPYPRVVLGHLQVANLIHERLNAKRKKLRINTTQMLILAALSAGNRLNWVTVASVSDLAAELQLGRETVSAQLKGMAEDGLVAVAEPAPDEDQRWRRYRVTSVGEVKAREVRQLLVQLDKVFRVLLGHKLAQAHPRAIGRLAKGLPSAPSLDDAHAADRFRYQTIRERRERTVARKSPERPKPTSEKSDVKER